MQQRLPQVGEMTDEAKSFSKGAKLFEVSQCFVSYLGRFIKFLLKQVT